jgi:hypothetical protein
VEQEGVIGLLGDSNAIAYDYLLRMQGDTDGYENVLRGPETDAGVFAGAVDANGNPLDPDADGIGEIVQVIDNYRNLGPREIEGYDIGVFYEVDDTPFGDWDVSLNFARLLTFFQSPGPEQQALINAQQGPDPLVNPFINIPGAESLIEENGRPEWRASSTITWRAGPWGAGLYSAYVGGVNDTGAALPDGTLWRVKPWLTHNAYVQYTIEADDDRLIDSARIRFGARNIFDEPPPLADTDTGYIGDLHSPRGRTVYFSVRTRF